ncbi:MAG: hypothetical protein K0S65_329 [Labilithrix sp.]|nr:hypothetical protein [Labilithrix sp.]
MLRRWAGSLRRRHRVVLLRQRNGMDRGAVLRLRQQHHLRRWDGVLLLRIAHGVDRGPVLPRSRRSVRRGDCVELLRLRQVLDGRRLLSRLIDLAAVVGGSDRLGRVREFSVARIHFRGVVARGSSGDPDEPAVSLPLPPPLSPPPLAGVPLPLPPPAAPAAGGRSSSTEATGGCSLLPLQASAANSAAPVKKVNTMQSPRSTMLRGSASRMPLGSASTRAVRPACARRKERCTRSRVASSLEIGIVSRTRQCGLWACSSAVISRAVVGRRSWSRSRHWAASIAPPRQVGVASARPVAVFFFRSAFGSPSKTTRPPASPASGPSSTTQSAFEMTSG